MPVFRNVQTQCLPPVGSIFRYHDFISRVPANACLAVPIKDYKMPFWVKRIGLKSGEVVTERELRPDENFSPDEAPLVGDEILVTCRGRTFKARVIWGNFGNWKDRPPEVVMQLRVEEI